MKFKSIFQLDWALNMQMEHEKCLEKMFHSNAQIEPTLLVNERGNGRIDEMDITTSNG